MRDFVVGVVVSVLLSMLPGVAGRVDIRSIDSFGLESTSVASIAVTPAVTLRDNASNGSFEIPSRLVASDAKDWGDISGNDATATRVNTEHIDGLWSMELVHGTVSALDAATISGIPFRLPGLASENKRVLVRAKGETGGELMLIQLVFQDIGHTPIGTATTPNLAVTTSWDTYELVTPIDAGAVYGVVNISENDNVATAKKIWVDDVDVSSISSPKSAGLMSATDKIKLDRLGTVATLNNKTGGTLVLGDVVAIDLSAAGAIKTVTAASYLSSMLGVVQETILNNAPGAVLLYGYTSQINLTASASVGDYVFTSTTAKKAARSAVYLPGAFGQVVGTGLTPPAIIFSQPQWITFNHNGQHAPGGGDVIPDLDSGTSFPGSPSNNRRFFRTDLGVACVYNSALSLWLGTSDAVMDLSNYLGANDISADVEFLVSAGDGEFAFLVKRFGIAWYNFGTNNGSNYWIMTLRRLNSGASTVDMAALDTHLGSGGTWTPQSTGTFSNNPVAANDIWLQVNITHVGAPGTMRLAGAKIRGRYVYT